VAQWALEAVEWVLEVVELVEPQAVAAA